MAALTISKSFTAVGVGQGLAVKNGDNFTYSVSGTFVGTVLLEYTRDGGISYQPANISATGSASGTVYVSTPDQGAAMYRFRCSAYTSGTIVTSMTEGAIAPIREFKDASGNTVLAINEDGIAVTGSITNTTGAAVVGTSGVFSSNIASGTTAVSTQAISAIGDATQSVLSGVTQTGSLVNLASTSAATTRTSAFEVGSTFGTQAASYTSATVVGFNSPTFIKGAASTITRAVNFLATAQTVGTNNATLADNITFTGNWFIHQTGSQASCFSAPICYARLNVASTATIAALSSANGFVKLTGSTATDLQGIAAGLDGQILRLWNATGQTLTIRNASASAASGNKITTCTGADITTTGNGFAEFVYDTDASPAVWVASYVTA